MLEHNDGKMKKLYDAMASKSEEELLNCFEIAKTIHDLKCTSNGKIESIAFSCKNEEDGLLIKDAYEYFESQQNCDCDETYPDEDGCAEGSSKSNEESCSDKIEELEEMLENTLELLKVASEAGIKLSKKFTDLQNEYKILEDGLKDLTAKYGR